MKIVICEDERAYQEALKAAIGVWRQESAHEDVEVVTYASSEDLLEQFERRMDVDLLFVDIQIPGELSGIELARRVRETCLDVTIVFCTNYSEYVYEGYTVNALRFLKKPVAQEDVSFCCDYVYDRLIVKNADTLTILSSGRRYVLRYSEIRYLEIRKHDLYISTTLREEPFRVNARLSDVMAQLPGALFVLCHRSYAVNVAHIRMLTRGECLLLNRESIPISRTYVGDVALAFDRYHQGGGGFRLCSLWHSKS